MKTIFLVLKKSSITLGFPLAHKAFIEEESAVNYIKGQAGIMGIECKEDRNRIINNRSFGNGSYEIQPMELHA